MLGVVKNTLAVLVVLALVSCTRQTPDPKISQLEARVIRQDEQIAQARKEIEDLRKIVGNLLGAMKLLGATLQAQEQATIAIPTYLPAPTPTYSEAGSTRASDPPENPCRVLSVSSLVTETNSSWSRYSWKLTLSNTSNKPVECDAEVHFKDAGGYIIATDSEHNLNVKGFSQAEFSGFDLIRTPGDKQVVTTTATVKAD